MKKQLVILLLLINCIANGQSTNLVDKWQPIFEAEQIPESLQTAFFEAKIDTAQIIALDKIGDYLFFEVSPQKALKFYEGSLELAKQANIKRREGLSLYYIADVYFTLGESEQSNQAIESAINIFSSIDDYDGLARVYRLRADLSDTPQQALVWLNKASIKAQQAKNRSLERTILERIAGMYSYMDDYDKSSEIYFQVLKSAQEDKDSTSIAWIYRKVGSVFTAQKKFSKAEEYYNKANTYFQIKGNGRDKAFLNQDRGLLYFELENYEQSAILLEKALVFWYQYREPQRIYEILRALGLTLTFQGEYQQAIDTIQKVFIMEAEGKVKKHNRAYFHFLLGKSYIGLNQCDKGVSYLQLAQDSMHYAYSNPFENADFYNQYYDDLVTLYHQCNQPTKANEIYQKWLPLKDSMIASTNQKRIDELEASYKNKEQKAQLETQETQIQQQRRFNILLGILAIVLLSFGIFAYRTAQTHKQNNITLQNQSKQLQSLDKAKSRFFANISHELRTPLTLIIAPLNNALKRVKDTVIKDDLAIAQRNSKKLLTLVNEILDLTKLENGQMQLNVRPVHLESFLRRVLFSYHSLANIRGLMLSFQYYVDKHLVIETDISKLEKIINNLLSNALKYSNNGGAITLSATAVNQNQLMFTVSDQGKGIAPKDLEKIFDRFYQVEGQNEPIQGGTGIGLSLAKELAEVLGGSLAVSSELNKGTTFTVILPLVKGTLPQQELEAISENEDLTEEGITYIPISLHGERSQVLVVEDNPEMSKFLTKVLSPFYQCTTVHDGQAALKLLQHQSFDLITSDVMMPNMDGYTLLEKVRQDANTQYTPFILLTARSMEADKLKGLQLGVDDYITKPFSINELIARINNLLTNQINRKSWKKEAADKASDKTTGNLSADKALLKKAEQYILKNIDNPNYRVEDLAKDMTYSRRQLSRIIREMTGMTLVEFIREIRLLKAYQLLEMRQYLSVAEVRYAVGIENSSYFAKVFLKRFGVKPKEVLGGN
jgi:signal transduction histidine kinase/DNA-binding response OmpR family regulator